MIITILFLMLIMYIVVGSIPLVLKIVAFLMFIFQIQRLYASSLVVHDREIAKRLSAPSYLYNQVERYYPRIPAKREQKIIKTTLRIYPDLTPEDVWSFYDHAYDAYQKHNG